MIARPLWLAPRMSLRGGEGRVTRSQTANMTGSAHSSAADVEAALRPARKPAVEGQKKRGRQPGAKKEGAATGVKKAATPSRGRGRPKKVKRKGPGSKKAAPETAAEGDVTMTESTAPVNATMPDPKAPAATRYASLSRKLLH